MVKVLQQADDQDSNPGCAIYLAALTTESSPWSYGKNCCGANLGQAMHLPRLEIMTGPGKEVCLPKKRRVSKKGGTKIRPGWVDIIPGVILSTSAWEDMVPSPVSSYSWGWSISWLIIHIELNSSVEPPFKANLAGSIHLVGLADPQYQFLKKIGVAGSSFMGKTYPLAHQQVPSTMASLYATNCPETCTHSIYLYVR